jgi:RNA polymerase sigma-70 factor (ECF subfamily)
MSGYLADMNPGLENSPDNATVCRFIAGDRQAFDEIYSSLASQVLAFLAARSTTMQNAEDVSQDVWNQVWKKRESFDGTHLKGWVFQIARNRLIDHARSSKRHERTSLENGHDIAERIDPGATIQREEELNAFRDCVKSVGGVFVEAVVRTQIAGESPEDLAKQQGVARATIDTRVSRGKQQLRDCMEQKKT